MFDNVQLASANSSTILPLTVIFCSLPHHSSFMLLYPGVSCCVKLMLTGLWAGVVRTELQGEWMTGHFQPVVWKTETQRVKWIYPLLWIFSHICAKSYRNDSLTVPYKNTLRARESKYEYIQVIRHCIVWEPLHIQGLSGFNSCYQAKHVAWGAKEMCPSRGLLSLHPTPETD